MKILNKHLSLSPTELTNSLTWNTLFALIPKKKNGHFTPTTSLTYINILYLISTPNFFTTLKNFTASHI